MSAVEEIRAAIEKLTKLAERNSTPGPWFLAHEGATHPRIWGNPDDDGAGADHVATMARFAGDADLIVTLHRTIDAQLAILSIGGHIMEHFSTGNGQPLDEHMAILALASAINGTV